MGYPLMALGAVIIFVSIFGSSYEGVAFIKYPVLVYLGKISFGLYAYHILALRCAYYLFRNYHHGFQMTFSLITSLAITLVMATVSFKWLESPFLRLKQQKFTYVPSGPVIDRADPTNLEVEQNSCKQPSEAPATSNEANTQICAIPISGSLESALIEP